MYLFIILIKKDMYTENIKASDAKLQSLGISFNFTTENDKLLI